MGGRIAEVGKWKSGVEKQRRERKLLSKWALPDVMPYISRFLLLA